MKKYTTDTPLNPSGICFCGCGKTTKIASKSDSQTGSIIGEHKRYIQGHSGIGEIPPIPAEERFWNSVDKSGDCWLWTAARNKAGYGLFSVRRKNTLAHRFSHQLAYGPIPDGMKICHHCDTPSCVRPSHLFCGTDADNVADKVAKGRCPQGESHTSAKLTEADVRQIRYDSANGATSVSLAKRHKVLRQTISKIVRRRSWKHVE